jgi:hypothetical protein
VVKRFAASLGALGLMLLIAAPALAVDLNQHLPISSDDAGYQGTETECADADLEAGQVLWHFVINQSSTNNQTITLTFANAGTDTYSPTKVVDTYLLQYDVYTSSGDTLTAATSSGNDGTFVLSHICNGGPPPEVPEAPASALLLLTAALSLGFVGWRMRRSETGA